MAQIDVIKKYESFPALGQEYYKNLLINGHEKALNIAVDIVSKLLFLTGAYFFYKHDYETSCMWIAGAYLQQFTKNLCVAIPIAIKEALSTKLEDVDAKIDNIQNLIKMAKNAK